MAKVLIVDDEQQFRDVLCKFAMRHGHDVETAGDAPSALDCGREMLPDILVIDWMLKCELNGLEVSQLLTESISSLVTIVITGDLSLELSSELAKAGRTTIMRKPFNLVDFKAALDHAALRSNSATDR